MPSNSQVNELIRERLHDQPAAVRMICENLIAAARHLPERALEAHLEDLVRKAVKRGEDKP